MAGIGWSVGRSALGLSALGRSALGLSAVGPCAIWLGALALGAGGLGPLVAEAQDVEAEAQDVEVETEARARFAAGSAAYTRGDFETALSDFEQAYRLSPRPALLFNIGLAAQRARRRERALEALRGYLAAVPDASNRADVEARLAELEELLAAERLRAGAGAGDGDPDSAGPGALPWILIGGSAAAAIGGAVLLALAQADISTVEDVADGGRWSEISDAYDRAPLRSGLGFALLGVGIAGAAAGVVLLAAGGEQRETRASVTLSLGAGAIDVKGAW